MLVMFFIAYAWIKSGLAQRFALGMIFARRHRRQALCLCVRDRNGSDFDGRLGRNRWRDFHRHCSRRLRQAEHPAGFEPWEGFDDGDPIGAPIRGIGTPAGSSINLLGLSMIEANGGAWCCGSRGHGSRR
jgi:hypothetical protein